MGRALSFGVFCFAVVGCCASSLGGAEGSELRNGSDLRTLRAHFVTSVSHSTPPNQPPPPPPEIFELVSYRAPLGDNVAYVSPVTPGVRRPGIVWIAGGFDWSIGEFAWEPQPRENDQSARAFREAGIALMLPALRGSSGNPGHNECFFGEVDDILAAAEYLASRPDVDPARIYLGGHSTGGTLALLAAESSDRFRGVIAFGPIADPRMYGPNGCLPPRVSDAEARVRAPIAFIDRIRTPTLVIEGSLGNAPSLTALSSYAGAAPVTFVVVRGFDHFQVLAPGTEVVARAILADTGVTCTLSVDAATIGGAY